MLTPALQMIRITVNAGEDEEADVLVDRLETTTTRYKMEIGPDKTKVMTNNPNGFCTEIQCQKQWRTSSVSLMKDPSIRFFSGLPK